VVRETFARADDLPARLGGEEFGALLPETTLAAAMNLGEVLRTRIERLGMQHSASQVARCVTASVGVAAFVPSAGTVAMELLGAADAALYQAKRAGRNRVHGVEGNITDSEGGEGNGQQSEG
jgi:diguanylate cyclase (GGDEF)-like protein